MAFKLATPLPVIARGHNERCLVGPAGGNVLASDLRRLGTDVYTGARATRLTMDREGIRRLAAEELRLQTSPYRFARNEREYRRALDEIGLPNVTAASRAVSEVVDPRLNASQTVLMIEV